jgi:hypothetical protein
MELKKVSELNSEERTNINQLVDLCSFSTPFHKIEWLAIVEKLLNDEVYYLFDHDSEKKINFALPFFFKKGYLYYDMHSFSMDYDLVYGGPLMHPDELLTEVSTGMLMENNMKQAKSLIMTLPPRFPIAHCQKKNLMHICNTPIFDLTPDIDTIWQSFPYKNVRCNINKAYKNNIRVIADATGHLEIFHKYLGKTLRSFNKPVLPFQYYMEIMQLPFMHIFSAIHGDQPIAIGIIAAHKDTVYYWANSSSLEHRNYRPNDLLVWEIIKWTKEHNYKYFDFLITPLSDLPGIIRFKLKFGGEIYPIYQYRLKNFHQIVSKSLYYISHPGQAISRICRTPSKQ